MTPDLLQPGIISDLTTVLTKVFILIILFLYTIFAAVLLRQVQIMNRIITLANFSPVLSAIALIHLFLSIGLTLFAFLLL